MIKLHLVVALDGDPSGKSTYEIDIQLPAVPREGETIRLKNGHSGRVSEVRYLEGNQTVDILVLR